MVTDSGLLGNAFGQMFKCVFAFNQGEAVFTVIPIPQTFILQNNLNLGGEPGVGKTQLGYAIPDSVWTK